MERYDGFASGGVTRKQDSSEAAQCRCQRYRDMAIAARTWSFADIRGGDRGEVVESGNAAVFMGRRK
jgi:hypothetical protein